MGHGRFKNRYNHAPSEFTKTLNFECLEDVNSLKKTANSCDITSKEYWRFAYVKEKWVYVEENSDWAGAGDAGGFVVASCQFFV